MAREAEGQMAIELTSLDRPNWQIRVPSRSVTARKVHALRDLKADWRRWSIGERTVVLLIAVAWGTALLTIVTLGGA